MLKLFCQLLINLKNNGNIDYHEIQDNSMNSDRPADS